MAVRKKRKVMVTRLMHKELCRPFAELGIPAADVEFLAANHNAHDITGLFAVEWARVPPTTQTILENLGFTETGPHIVWIIILTKKMQELLDCSPTEIGIAGRDVNALEKTRDVNTLRDLLFLEAEQLHGIANFAKTARQQIHQMLRKAGFIFQTIPGNVVYVDEQDL